MSTASTIKASVMLPTPVERVRTYLAEGFARVAQGGPQRVPLIAHIPILGVVVSKNVILECTRIDGTDDWMIHWTPEPGGRYPSFEGRLSVAAGHDKTILTLGGNYTPPLGAAGKVFDEAIGRHVSDDSAHEFLMTLAAEMRARYAYEEALKEYAT